MNKKFTNLMKSVKLITSALFLVLLPQNVNGQQNLNTDMYTYNIGKTHYLISKENPYASYEIHQADWYCPYEYAAYDRSLGPDLINGLPELIRTIDESIADGSVSNNANEAVETIDKRLKDIENSGFRGYEQSIMSAEKYQNYLTELPTVFENIQELKDRITAFIESASAVYGEMWKMEGKRSQNERKEFPLYLTYLITSQGYGEIFFDRFSWDTTTWRNGWSLPDIKYILNQTIDRLTRAAQGSYDIQFIRVSDYQTKIKDYINNFENTESSFRNKEAEGALTQSIWDGAMAKSYEVYEQLSMYDEWIRMESDFVIAYMEHPQEVVAECLGYLNYLKDYAKNYIDNYKNHRNYINNILTTLQSFPGDMASMLKNQDDTFSLPENIVDDNGNSYEVRRIQRALPYNLEYDHDITVELPRTITAIMRPSNSADVIFGGFKNISKIISHNPVPPVLAKEERWGDNLSFADFATSVYNEATLIVPDESLEKYKDERTTWHYFNHFETSGVKEILNENSTEGYEVYSVAGYRIGSFADKSGLIDLTPGFYIIKHGTKSERYFVRH